MAALAMSQYDVYANPEHQRQPNTPYLVVIQSDHFIGARTAVVIPLVRNAELKTTTAVNPSFEVNGESVVLEPFQIAFIPARLLTQRIGSLQAERPLIVRAIDALMSGL